MAIFVIILTIFAFLSVVCVKNTLNILKNDAGYVVVLDAGHGAPDGGVVGTNTGVLESDLNLKMVKILQNYLENAGVKVVLTRKNKYALSGGAKGFKKRRLQTQKRDNRERKSRRGYQHSHELLQGSAVAARSAGVLRREKPVFFAVCGDAHAKNQYGNQQKIRRTGICCAFGRLLYNKFDVRSRRNRGMRIFK